jgi:hypothetical protein
MSEPLPTIDAIRIANEARIRCRDNRSLPNDGCHFDSGPYCGRHQDTGAAEEIEVLLVEVDRLQRKLDAAITRLQAELDRNRRLNDYDRHDLWLRDIIKDLNA